jgi:hypothetical protein
MRAFLFVVGDFLRVCFREAGMFGLWAASVALALLSAVALFGLPPYEAGPATSQRLILLTLSPLLSEAEITRLAWTIWAWPEVLQVSFRFPGETEPEPMGERTLVVEVPPQADREAIGAKLGKLAGVTKVTVLERTVVPPRVPSVARIGAVAALSVSLAGSLFLGVRTLRRSQKRWEREQRLLRDSGAGPLFWWGPIFVGAGLCGLLGAGLHVLALRLGVRFIPAEGIWTQLLSLEPWTVGLGIPAGLVLGLLAAFLVPHS